MSNCNTSANEGEKLTRAFVQRKMEEMGLNMHQLQRLTGVNETTVGRWLRGQTSISYNNFLKICGALDIWPDFIPEDDNLIGVVFD